MSTSIEAPAMEIVGPLALNAWRGEYSREQWRAVGLWWAKVLLLIGHPHSVLENARLQKLVRWHFDSVPDVRWLTDGSGVPRHVSVFVHNVDYSKTGTEHELVIPAHVFFDGGSSADCHVMSLATHGMAVAAVSHPGVTLEHPLVESGHAWELLHAPPRRGDIGKLKPLSRDNVRYLRGGGVPSGHVANASDTARVMGLFGYGAEQRAPADSQARVKARLRRLLTRKYRCR